MPYNQGTKSLVTTGELMDILRMSFRNLQALEARGEIQSISDGHTVRYDLDKLICNLKKSDN